MDCGWATSKLVTSAGHVTRTSLYQGSVNDESHSGAGRNDWRALYAHLAELSGIMPPEINWDEDKLKGEYVSKWHIGNTFNKPVTFE